MQSQSPSASSDGSRRQGIRGPRIRTVLERTGISRTHLYRMIGRREFPAPRHLSERVVVWDEAEIDLWLETKFQGGR